MSDLPHPAPPNEDVLCAEHKAMLSRKICDLSLVIPDTRLEELIQQLYAELEAAGISLRPKAYLSDEWGCPNAVPVIGIPFYLANPKLQALEGRLTGVEAEDESEALMFLRHEAGHAFDYAYRLHAQREWRRVFGSFSRRYNESYRPSPFSARFVHNIPGWYAQKHPEDDFAETFAVWLTPGSRWRETYAGAPALAKLLYVDRVVARYGRKPPVVTDETLDAPVQELTITLGAWYRACGEADRDRASLPDVINQDLRNLLPDTDGSPAADGLEPIRHRLVGDVYRWTGVNRHLLSALLDELLRRSRLLELKLDPGQAPLRIMGVAVFLTTLAMNYQRTGKFMET